LAAMGSGTANVLASLNLNCDFVGSGSPSEVSRDFSKVLGDDKVLFPRAEASLRSIQKGLAHPDNVFDLVVYSTRELVLKEQPKVDVLVFTSPSNVRAYLSMFSPTVDQHCLAIGPSTQKELENKGVKKIVVAREPSEQALAEAVMSL